jgi:hypothetical protein
MGLRNGIPDNNDHSKFDQLFEKEMVRVKGQAQDHYLEGVTHI